MQPPTGGTILTAPSTGTRSRSEERPHPTPQLQEQQLYLHSKLDKLSGPVLLRPQGGAVRRPGCHRALLRRQTITWAPVPARPAGAALVSIRGRHASRPPQRPRPRLLRPSPTTDRRQTRRPIAGPQDRPAGLPHPHRARRRRTHHQHPLTGNDCSDHGATIHRCRQPPWPAPFRPLSAALNLPAVQGSNGPPGKTERPHPPPRGWTPNQSSCRRAQARAPR
jgi:hypothetical protein